MPANLTPEQLAAYQAAFQQNGGMGGFKPGQNMMDLGNGATISAGYMPFQGGGEDGPSGPPTVMGNIFTAGQDANHWNYYDPTNGAFKGQYQTGNLDKYQYAPFLAAGAGALLAGGLGAAAGGAAGSDAAASTAAAFNPAVDSQLASTQLGLTGADGAAMADSAYASGMGLGPGMAAGSAATGSTGGLSALGQQFMNSSMGTKLGVLGLAGWLFGNHGGSTPGYGPDPMASTPGSYQASAVPQTTSTPWQGYATHNPLFQSPFLNQNYQQQMPQMSRPMSANPVSYPTLGVQPHPAALAQALKTPSY